MDERYYAFLGGSEGPWAVRSVQTLCGEPLARVSRVAVQNRWLDAPPSDAAWMLRGVVSNTRYVTRAEQQALAAVQAPLGRPDCTLAAMIPISKTAGWWALPQDERRAILEDRSAHIAVGLRYLPGIARRLHHGRDLGEPFDFVTWFDYAPADAAAFDDLLAALRQTEEWRYVEREVDIRLERAPD